MSLTWELLTICMFWHFQARTVKVPPADPAVVDKLRATFEKIAGDDMEIDAYELRDILNAAYGNGMYTCSSFI